MVERKEVLMQPWMLQISEEVFLRERTRIVRLCAALTGNAAIAEDLAQEVFLEAWRSLPRLRDRQKFSSWLSGIAHHVCLRWVREQARLARCNQSLGFEDRSLEELLATDVDIEEEFERKELLTLLDRALAFLTPSAREILIARYVEEASLAEIADHLGLHVSTASMRLQRAKGALRRLVSNNSEDWQGYGLPTRDTWEETSIWCTRCGRHRLRGRFAPTEAILVLTCPACGDYSQSHFASTCESQLFQGLKRTKPALARLRSWMYRYYHAHLEAGAAPCVSCHKRASFHLFPFLNEQGEIATTFEYTKKGHGVFQVCPHCTFWNWISLSALLLARPEGLHFLNEHARIRTLPEQEIETDGQEAIITRFESVGDRTTLEIVSTKDTYQVLSLNGSRL